jgi:hypothetical protein
MIETTSLHESLLESFSGPGWSRLVLTLVHSLWQGEAVALLLVLALKFSAGRRSQLRYSLCCFALLAAPAGSLLTWSWLSHGDHREAALTSGSAESPDHSAGFATMPDANVQPVASSGLASAAT